jgi:hypothetical protein
VVFGQNAWSGAQALPLYIPLPVEKPPFVPNERTFFSFFSKTFFLKKKEKEGKKTQWVFLCGFFCVGFSVWVFLCGFFHCVFFQTFFFFFLKKRGRKKKLKICLFSFNDEKAHG